MVDYELMELKREFLAEAEEKVREIQRVLDGERDAAGLDRLAYLAHQLKGSGGSYGYEKISSDAAEIEKAVESIAAGGSNDVEAKIQQHAVNLRGEITKATRELSTATA
jgi:chemotaxis protein histidine kinase CheA